MENYFAEKQYNVMTRQQARDFDSWAINAIGIPGVVLMENAGRSCAELVKEKLNHIAKPKVCIFCGVGNNGGDGYVIARHLINCDYQVCTVIIGEPGKIKGDAKINLDVLCSMNQKIEHITPDEENIENQVLKFASNANMIIDAIFGTGLSGPVKGGYSDIIKTINTLECPVLAIDIPSGLDCDTGQCLGQTIIADYTVTFGALKKGFLSEQANKYTGQIYIASIGINPA